MKRHSITSLNILLVSTSLLFRDCLTHRCLYVSVYLIIHCGITLFFCFVFPWYCVAFYQRVVFPLGRVLTTHPIPRAWMTVVPSSVLYICNEHSKYD